MVPGANGDALAVEDGADVVRVDAFDDEADDGRFLLSGSDEPNAGEGAEFLGRVGDEFRLVGGDRIESDVLDVLDGNAESASNLYGSSL